MMPLAAGITVTVGIQLMFRDIHTHEYAPQCAYQMLPNGRHIYP